MKYTHELQVRVEDVSVVADRIKKFRLVPVDRSRLPTFSGGAQITVHIWRPVVAGSVTSTP